MAEHHPNFINRVKLIQEEFSKYDDGTRTISAIWEHWIHPKFFISLATLRRLLEIKIKKT